jgi:hypothetical protein
MRNTFNEKVVGTAALVAVAMMLVSSPVAATPLINSAVIQTRIFDDCPTSILTTTNSYPGMISIFDDVLDCGGFANLHIWRLSDDGITPALFANASAFKFSANLTIAGTAEGEAGLQIAPWWSQQVDGRFNVRTTDGEIACFGGRLPFYSFTATDGVTYVKGTAIRLTVEYLPNDLNEANPATIEYRILYNNTKYSSGPIPFDMGNPDEDPPYGLWGMLNDAQVGAHFQVFLQAGNPDAGLEAVWNEIKFISLKGPIATESESWGQIKALYH